MTAEHGLLHRLFEAQADATPDAMAVFTDNEGLTYRELDVRANQIAWLLREHGVGPDVVVGVLMERSIDLPAILLGIMKAGGAYLPLNVDSPAPHLLDLLDTAGAALCLSQDGTPAGLPPGRPGSLCLPRELRRPEHRPAVRMFEDNLVSVYHTSGSTGRPKAVANTHRGWVNRMLWMQAAHRLGPGEKVLQKTTLTFDDSAVEFFWPLTAGGAVVMLGPGLHQDMEAIRAAAARHRVAVLQFVPSWLAEFLASLIGKPADLPGLRLVVSSGEQLRPALVRRFREVFGDRCELRNLWGLTETSIDSTAYTCTGADTGGGPVPIGRPVDATDVVVLDDRLRPCEPDVVGELYIGGAGLARCYLGEPARTAERFVASPFAHGARLYRTGDRGSSRADGELVFLGRQDRQVQLRGIRIELGEIEQAMTRHPSVVNAVVLAADDHVGEPRLVAYAAGPSVAPAAELRGFLAERLPAYMLPSLIVPLATMPKTASGKADLSRLPAPERSAPATPETPYRPPRTDVQRALADLWCQVLGRARIGLDDDFFALGGQSVQATRVMSRIRAGFGVELPLQVLFDGPTVGALSAVVETAVREAVAALSDEEVARRLASGPS